MTKNWTNKTRHNATAKLPYAYLPTDDDPLALEPDWDCVKWVEQGLDHLENGHSTRKVAAWIIWELCDEKVFGHSSYSSLPNSDTF